MLETLHDGLAISTLEHAMDKFLVNMMDLDHYPTDLLHGVHAGSELSNLKKVVFFFIN